MKKIVFLLFLSLYVAYLITNEFIQQTPPRKKESRNTLLQCTGDLLMTTMQKAVRVSQLIAAIQEKILIISCDAINQEYGTKLSNDQLSCNRDSLKLIDDDMTRILHQLKNIEYRVQQVK